MADTFDWMIQNIIVGEIFITYCMFWATDMLSFLKWGCTCRLTQTRRRRCSRPRRCWRPRRTRRRAAWYATNNVETLGQLRVEAHLDARLRDAHALRRGAADVRALHLRRGGQLAALPGVRGAGGAPPARQGAGAGHLEQSLRGPLDMYFECYAVCRFFNILLIIGGLAGVGSIYIPWLSIW